MSVFVEKPLCTTMPELDELGAAARRCRRHVIAGSAATLRADVRALGALVAAGAVGTPTLLELSWARSRGIPRPGSWFTNRKLAGGGALVDLGWHLLEVGLGLLGWPGVEHAAGVGSSSFLDDPAWRADWRMDVEAAATPLDVEDTFTGFLAVAGGAGVTIHVAWASHEPLDVTSVRIHGDRATASLRTTFGFSPNRVLEPELVVVEGGEATRHPVEHEPVGREYDRLLDVVDDVLAGREPPATNPPRAVLDAIGELYAAGAAPGGPAA
jgi:oxidoreductase